MSGNRGNGQHEKHCQPVHRVRKKFDVDDLHLTPPSAHFALHVFLHDSEQKKHDKRHEYDGDPVGKIPTEYVFICHLHSPFHLKVTCPLLA